MKRWVLSATEEAIRDRCVNEYLDARKARSLAIGQIANETVRRAVAVTEREYTGMIDIRLTLANERLAAAREAIRLTTDILRIVRRF